MKRLTRGEVKRWTPALPSEIIKAWVYLDAQINNSTDLCTCIFYLLRARPHRFVMISRHFHALDTGAERTAGSDHFQTVAILKVCMHLVMASCSSNGPSRENPAARLNKTNRAQGFYQCVTSNVQCLTFRIVVFGIFFTEFDFPTYSWTRVSPDLLKTITRMH